MAEQDYGAETIERQSDIYKDAPSIHAFWMNALRVAGKEEQEWRDAAQAATEIYRADKKRPTKFNILHSNVQTIVPSLYNSTPEPDVRTRYGDKNEIAREGAQVLERGLKYQLDEYDFDDVALACVRDMQIAGRGVARIRYRPYLHNDQENGESVVWEETTCERVQWKRFRRGPGSMWSEVPWVAYEHALTRDEFIQLAGEDVGKKVPLDLTEDGIDEKASTREKSAFMRGLAWEIWDKDRREVLFIAPGYKDGPLHVEPDPLGLLGFFDCAPPLQAISDPDTLVPVVPYEIYRSQAEELAEISSRISKLVAVLRFRGIRASEVPELDILEELEDGEFTPSAGAMALLGGNKGLNDAIWVMPLDVLINTIRELVSQREAIKQVIYEITGIADILRGATNPNETLGAQQIKAQWGSVRVQEEQRAVQRWCRDIFRLKAEIIGNKFSDRALSMIAGEELEPQIVELLRSDVRRSYLIDIETDSTIRGDLLRAQQNMAGFMDATGRFIQTFVPLMQSGQMPPQLIKAAVAVYSSFIRQFKLGKQAEDAIAALDEASDALIEQGTQQDPQARAEQEDAKQLNRAAMVADIEDTQAKTEKTRADAAKTAVEAQRMATGADQAPEPVPEDTSVDDAVQLETARSNIRKTDADIAKMAADADNEARKAAVDTAKTMAEIEAQAVETDAIRKGKKPGPGFVQ